MPSEIQEFKKDIVEKVYKLLQGSEYKRSQAAVGTKISKQSFEKSEWRVNL